MSTGKTLRLIMIATAFYICFSAPVAYASGGGCNSITVAVQTATGGATVTGSGGVFSVSFGNVNGLGISSPAAGVTVSPLSNGARYTTPVTVTITYSGCSGGLSFTVTVFQDGTKSANSQAAAREGTTAAGVVTVPNSQASGTTIYTQSGNNGNGTLTLNRFVGLFVSNANGGSNVSGALNPKYTYLFTAQ